MQVFVVEGKNDESKLKRIFPGINVVSVNGSETNKDTINYLKTINKTHEIILCMDPDYPGKQIRSKLEAELTNVSHIFFERKTAISKNGAKIGLEHIDDKLLIKQFSNKIKFDNNKTKLELNDLFKVKLIGHKNSQKLRDDLTTYLNIDNCNGKRLLNRLNSMNFNYYDLKEVIASIN